MMKDLSMFPAKNSPYEGWRELTCPPAVISMLEKLDDKEAGTLASLLVFTSFRSNVQQTSEIHPEWALTSKEKAGPAPYAKLTSMKSKETSGDQVAMWFLNSKIGGLDKFERTILAPFLDAVTNHSPPSRVLTAPTTASSKLNAEQECLGYERKTTGEACID